MPKLGCLISDAVFDWKKQFTLIEDYFLSSGTHNNLEQFNRLGLFAAFSLSCFDSFLRTRDCITIRESEQILVIASIFKYNIRFNLLVEKILDNSLDAPLAFVASQKGVNFKFLRKRFLNDTDEKQEIKPSSLLDPSRLDA